MPGRHFSCGALSPRKYNCHLLSRHNLVPVASSPQPRLTDSPPACLPAFCLSWQLSGLGDAERVFMPSNPHYYYGPRGVNSVMTQRIVRQAAVALKDLHSLAGSMHLDIKVNNLLVGDAAAAARLGIAGDRACWKSADCLSRLARSSRLESQCCDYWQCPEHACEGCQGFTRLQATQGTGTGQNELAKPRLRRPQMHGRRSTRNWAM